MAKRSASATVAFLVGTFGLDRVMDQLLFPSFMQESRHNLTKPNEVPSKAHVNLYIGITHVSYLLAATLYLSVTPHIILPSLIMKTSISIADYEVFKRHITKNRQSIMARGPK